MVKLLFAAIVNDRSVRYLVLIAKNSISGDIIIIVLAKRLRALSVIVSFSISIVRIVVRKSSGGHQICAYLALQNVVILAGGYIVP